MFRDRNTLLVVAARLISRMGGYAAFFVGMWGKAAFEFDATPTQLAVIMAVLGIASLIGSAVAGTLIDRYGPKRVLIGSEILFAPATLAAILVSNIAALAVVAFAIGLFGSPNYAAITSFPAFLTNDETKLAKINSGVEAAGTASLIGGAAVGGALAKWISIDSIFVFDALTSLIAVALVAWVRLEIAHADEGGPKGGFAETKEGFSFVYTHPRLRFYVLLTTAFWMIFGLFGALEPLFYRDVLNRGPDAIGLVNSIFGIGLVAGTAAASRFPATWRTARMTLAVAAANGLGANLYVGTTHLTVVIAGGVVWGFVIGVFNPLSRTLIHINSPENMVGRVMGTTLAHSESAQLLPLVFAPALAAAFGPQRPLMVGGLVLTVGALAFWRVAAGLDHTRATQVPPLVSGPIEVHQPIVGE